MQFTCAFLAGGLCNIKQLASTEQQGSSITYQYENWRITNCSPQQTQGVITAVDQISGRMPDVLKEAALGSDSDTYKIFFKLSSRSATIQRVFQQIGKGDQVICDNEVGEKVYKTPEFVCVQPNDWTAYYWLRCGERNAGGTSFKGQPYVVLCPNFWSKGYPGVSATEQPTCPVADDEGHLPNDSKMVQVKAATVLHELWHLYTGHNQRSPELYGLRDCSGLLVADAIRNANNFAFFAASRWMNCTKWPTNMKRLLLARDDGNGTTAAPPSLNATQPGLFSYGGPNGTKSFLEQQEPGIIPLNETEGAKLEPVSDLTNSSFDILGIDPGILETVLNRTT